MGASPSLHRRAPTSGSGRSPLAPSTVGSASTCIRLTESGCGFASRKAKPRATIYFNGVLLTTRQYTPLLAEWLSLIGFYPSLFGTHSLRRTKATLIYRKTGNLRAVQLLLGRTKIESTVRYLGIEVDDALAIAEQVEV